MALGRSQLGRPAPGRKPGVWSPRSAGGCMVLVGAVVLLVAAATKEGKSLQ
jgi:hypothetical protein